MSFGDQLHHAALSICKGRSHLASSREKRLQQRFRDPGREERLDGWGIPWYSHFFKVITQKWLANMFSFAERDPWGIKDPRIRTLVEQAISSGDSSRAGVAALPGSLMLELRWLVKQVKKEVGQVQQPTLIVHPREDDRASLRNLEYLQTNLAGLIELVVLDDSYHIVTLDRQRHLVVEPDTRVHFARS